MLKRKQELLNGLARAVITMDEESAKAFAEEIVRKGIDIREAILEGLSKGMAIVGSNYENGTYFVPEMLLCSDALNAAIDIFTPYLTVADTPCDGCVVIGVVEGDIHDIGKNLVKAMLKADGFTVHDIGSDVPLERFISEAQRVGARLICLSTLMTTSMGKMGILVRKLEEQGIRDRFKVLVGGSPVSQAFADAIHADGYASNAFQAVKKARELLGQRNTKNLLNQRVSIRL